MSTAFFVAAVLEEIHVRSAMALLCFLTFMVGAWWSYIDDRHRREDARTR